MANDYRHDDDDYDDDDDDDERIPKGICSVGIPCAHCDNDDDDSGDDDIYIMMQCLFVCHEK